MPVNPQTRTSMTITAGSQGAAPQQRRPTDEELVENRITNLLAGNNPYIQNARTRGVRQSASRGLLNSSLGAAAGESAAIAGAFPIASQDATTFASAAAQNQDHANRLAQMQMQADLEHWGQLNSAQTWSPENDPGQIEFRRRENELDRQLTREELELRRNEGAEERRLRLQMNEGDQAFQREMTLGDRAFRQREGESDRAFQERMANMGFDFQREEGETARAFQERIQAAAFEREARQRNNEMFQTILGSSIGTALQTIMGDPAASEDFMGRWASTIGNLLSRFGLGTPPPNAPPPGT
jgi:hypothetical protein